MIIIVTQVWELQANGSITSTMDTHCLTLSGGAGSAVNMHSCSGAAGSQTWLVKAVAGAADGSVTIATGDGKLCIDNNYM